MICRSDCSWFNSTHVCSRTSGTSQVEINHARERLNLENRHARERWNLENKHQHELSEPRCTARPPRSRNDSLKSSAVYLPTVLKCNLLELVVRKGVQTNDAAVEALHTEDWDRLTVRVTCRT